MLLGPCTRADAGIHLPRYRLSLHLPIRKSTPVIFDTLFILSKLFEGSKEQLLLQYISKSKLILEPQTKRVWIPKPSAQSLPLSPNRSNCSASQSMPLLLHSRTLPSLCSTSSIGLRVLLILTLLARLAWTIVHLAYTLHDTTADEVLEFVSTDSGSLR